MMNDEGQDRKTVYSFAQIDFCPKYVSFALLELLSTQTFVLLPQCVSPNCGPEKKSVSKIWRLEKKITLKYKDRKRKCIPKVGTGKEFYSRKLGPEEILLVPTFENQFLFQSPLLGYIFFSGPTLGIHFLFRSPYLRTDFISSPLL